MKHILFINPNKDTFTNPTLVMLFEQLAELSDVCVSLLSQEQIVAAPSHLHKIKPLDFPVFAVTWSKKIWSWRPKMKANRILKQFCRDEQVSVIVAIDPIGLIVGGRVKKQLPKIQLHYLSFELFFRNELNNFPYYQKIKKKEIYYSRFIDCLLVQDEERRNLLLNENKINLPGIQSFLLPVSPASSTADPNSRALWRSKLGISESQVILMHSGSLDKWSGGEYLLEILRNGLPENALLLIHSKEKLQVSNPIHRKLLDFKAKGYPVMIHDSLFENYAEYLGFLHVADLALALYQSDNSSPYTGKNIAHIGLASGKFACYMSQGIPAVVTHSAIYDRLVREFDFGFVVRDMAEFRQIIVSLDKEILLHKQQQALSLYREILDPAKSGRDYLGYLQENEVR
ncbi:MAG: glycosyl transferase family 2 [Crocinitomicaceae bacterium]|jgi:hypothetical protein|nr:glycosyl transferase family 2 [Crocinitomicaceae bacterium]